MEETVKEDVLEEETPVAVEAELEEVALDTGENPAEGDQVGDVVI